MGMHDTLRERLLRHIEALPDEQVYRALDYVEFLASKYARDAVKPARPLQRFGEVWEDKMRQQGVGMAAIRGTLGIWGTADRVFSGIADAGKSLLREVEAGARPASPQPEKTDPAANLPKLPPAGRQPDGTSPTAEPSPTDHPHPDGTHAP